MLWTRENGVEAKRKKINAQRCAGVGMIKIFNAGLYLLTQHWYSIKYIVL